MRSPQIMGGYWNLPEATGAPIQGDWFNTGDAGYLDDDGYLYIHDRVKDMIVSGGENIYPAEVENALFGHPAVADVAVIGVPDERWGEAVKAVVVKKPGAERHAGELIALGARAHRRLQAAEVGRLHRRAAAQPVRQDPEARAAQALLGRPRAPGELTTKDGDPTPGSPPPCHAESLSDVHRSCGRRPTGRGLETRVMVGRGACACCCGVAAACCMR